MQIRLGHLFSKTMNTYGDIGNAIALEKRCIWRNIDFEYIQINTLEELISLKEEKNKCDIYLFGGGQDSDQEKVINLINEKFEIVKKILEEEVNRMSVFLLICGGYQLFGKYFIDGNKNHINGFNILNIKTEAIDEKVYNRCIGNIVVEGFINDQKYKLIGFENHSGQTIINDKNKKDLKNLGNVIYGNGDNSKDKIGGSIYKNVFGCYLHGSLLPRNPAFTDYLIELALKNKYKLNTLKLEILNDSLENKSREEFINSLKL